MPVVTFLFFFIYQPYSHFGVSISVRCSSSCLKQEHHTLVWWELSFLSNFQHAFPLFQPAVLVAPLLNLCQSVAPPVVFQPTASGSDAEVQRKSFNCDFNSFQYWQHRFAEEDPKSVIIGDVFLICQVAIILV